MRNTYIPIYEGENGGFETEWEEEFVLVEIYQMFLKTNVISGI
jgi:hypothetical protein